MSEPLLQSQPVDDGDRGVRVVVQCVAAVGNLVERPEARVDRSVQHLRHQPRLVSPAHRAVGEHVEERRPSNGDRGGRPCGSSRASGSPPPGRRTARGARRRWRSCPFAAAPCRSSPCRQGSSWSTHQTVSRPSAGRRCSCTPRCRNRRRGSRGRAPSHPKAPAARCRRFRRRRRTRPRRPRSTEARSVARERAAHSRRRSQQLRRSRTRREAKARSRLCRVTRRRDFEATGRVDDDDRPVDRRQHRPDDQRDPATLAERVSAAERRHTVLVADHRLQTRHSSPRTPT